MRHRYRTEHIRMLPSTRTRVLRLRAFVEEGGVALRILIVPTLTVLALGAGCMQERIAQSVGGGPVVILGADLAQERCATCHDPGDGSYSGRTTLAVGMAYPKNLTPDPDTGIGGWTDAQITGAVRNGIDDQGQSLCPVMPRFDDLTDEQMRSLIDFLRNLAAVKKDIPDSTC
jgi:mono/diheme cytochrome c family protein